MNLELSDVQSGFRKGRGTRDPIASIGWIIHVNVWQKSLQYCKVTSLQLVKINEKN